MQSFGCGSYITVNLTLYMQYDLHTHSTVSDGTMTPTELVQHAGKNGVDVLALTDHDSTGGINEAMDAARVTGISLIGGVEISVKWERMTVHILGLDIDPGDVTLQEGLARLRVSRQWRAEEIGRKLDKAGFKNAYEGAKKYASGQLIGRAHFARYIVECGKASTVSDVFRKYLVRNKPGHVAGQWATLEDAVGWIRDAGGYAVIAHPARYKMSATKFRRFIEQFRENGGVGIEVVSGSHSPSDRHNMAQYAKRYGLYASQGSDYHGPENPWIEIGRLQDLPEGCKPVWALWT